MSKCKKGKNKEEREWSLNKTKTCENKWANIKEEKKLNWMKNTNLTLTKKNLNKSRKNTKFK